MIVYLAAGGALIALRWVFKDGAARRMLPYAISLGGATSVLFVLFASYANREMLCDAIRSEEHTSELQSLMRISYAVFCLKKKKHKKSKQELLHLKKLKS